MGKAHHKRQRLPGEKLCRTTRWGECQSIGSAIEVFGGCPSVPVGM